MAIGGSDTVDRAIDARGSVTLPILEQLEPRLLLSGNVFIGEFMADND
ncbi:MAG: LEPR-XLL domain-containing protein, partial [Phycisphaerales bacterium]|nr:LEPR-XLL domain-containing protein [Phycisphaerales bacterium]